MPVHKSRIAVPEDRQVKIRLPEDFPPGMADVIVISSFLEGGGRGESWADLGEPHPVLGKITFHEDPSRPLDPGDWPDWPDWPEE